MALRIPRRGHTATRLTDGRILLVGGSQGVDEYLMDVDIFNMTTGQTSQVAPLHRPRSGHSATLLQDGRVLIVGGYALSGDWVEDAEVYDPVANTWTIALPHYAHGVTHTATLLRDGRVLVVGGNVGSGLFTNRVEIFNPQTNAWTEYQPLASERANHTAQLLQDGRVLIAGGQTHEYGIVGADAVLYDPQANIWTPTGPMAKPRIWAQSARLPDGRVLVAGGMTLADMPTNTFTASAEIYDPATNEWSLVGDMSKPRYSHFLVSLLTGQIVAFGGAHGRECCWTASSFVGEIESFDPTTKTWRIVAMLPQPKVDVAATLLSDGCAWLSGGRWSYTTHAADSWLICAR